MSKILQLAIGSTMSIPGDIDGNLRQITSFARQAAADRAALLLTPEMSACGYGAYPEALATAETAGEGAIFDHLAALAAETGVVLCAGFVEAAVGKRYLAHYVVYPDGQFIVQRKHRVTPAERPLDAWATLSPVSDIDPIGQPLDPLRFTVFDVRGVRCAIAICADGGISGLHQHLATLGVDLLLGPAGAGGRREDRVVTADLYTEAGREQYLRVLETLFFPVPRENVMRCLQYGQGYAAVNMCGFDGRSLYHAGHGVIVNPMGETAALIHGLPNLDRQRPRYAQAAIDFSDRLIAPTEAARQASPV